jgi:hypothetical protein
MRWHQRPSPRLPSPTRLVLPSPLDVRDREDAKMEGGGRCLQRQAVTRGDGRWALAPCQQVTISLSLLRRSVAAGNPSSLSWWTLTRLDASPARCHL